MKTIILKAFFISVLVCGTFGSALAAGKAKGPTNEAECLALGGNWHVPPGNPSNAKCHNWTSPPSPSGD